MNNNKTNWWMILGIVIIVAILTSLITVKLTGNVINVASGTAGKVYSTYEIDTKISNINAKSCNADTICETKKLDVTGDAIITNPYGGGSNLELRGLIGTNSTSGIKLLGQVSADSKGLSLWSYNSKIITNSILEINSGTARIINPFGGGSSLEFKNNISLVGQVYGDASGLSFWVPTYKSIKFLNLASTDNRTAYVCVSSNGAIFRSLKPCA